MRKIQYLATLNKSLVIAVVRWIGLDRFDFFKASEGDFKHCEFFQKSNYVFSALVLDKFMF